MYPQVWRRVWTKECPANQLVFRSLRRVVDAVVSGSTRCYARRLVGLREGVGNTLERPIEVTAESLWTEVAGRLRGALNDTTYRTDKS